MQIINLYALHDWKQLEKGTALIFEGLPNQARACRLLLNVENVTTLYAYPQDAKSDARLLVTAGPGLVRVDFDAVGTFGVFADEHSGEVWFQSTEFESPVIDKVDEGTFTELAQRPEIDPLFEQMWYRANLNMERRLAAQQAEHERRMAAMIAETKTNDEPQGAPVVPSGSQVPAQDPPASGAQAAADPAAVEQPAQPA